MADYRLRQPGEEFSSRTPKQELQIDLHDENGVVVTLHLTPGGLHALLHCLITTSDSWKAGIPLVAESLRVEPLEEDDDDESDGY